MRASLPRRLMLAAVLLAGLAHLLILPPFEGFDEPAHWSSLSRIAHDGRIPVYGEDRLDAAVRGYPGPHAYSGVPPFDPAFGASYREWEPGRGPGETSPPGTFTPDIAPNWQAQHPPLYYLLMTPVFLASQHLSWVDHFAVLRLASWLMAFTGLVIGAEAACRRLPGITPGLGGVMAAWPFLFPQFFPEMARLGNDALCLLLAALVFRQTLEMEARGHTIRSGALLGLWLGLGLLTKAFFLPISAGGMAWLGWRWLAEGRGTGRLKAMAVTALTAGLIGGWFYVWQLAAHGTPTGGDEFIRFAEEGSVLAGLAENFSLPALVRGLAAIAGSFAWAGTWSLTRPPEILLAGPVLLMGFVLARCLWRARSLPPAALLPLFMAAPMAAGLVYHLLVRIAFTGAGSGTPGWYLHILAPALIVAVAAGWRGSRLIAPALAAWSAGLLALGMTLQLSLFSGCAGKGPGRRYDLSASDCLIDTAQLSALGRPGLAAGVGLAAASLALYAAWRTCRRLETA
jgi:hypothetical protein